MRLATLVLALGVVGLVSCGSPQTESLAPPQVTLEVGQPLPELILAALEDGRPASLSEFRGRKMLLHIFASW